MKIENLIEYIENISSDDKKLQPLIAIGNTKRYEISKFFDILNKEDIEELDRIYNYSQEINNIKKYEGTINKQTWFAYMCANNIEINTLTQTIKKSSIKLNDDSSISVNIRDNKKIKTLNFDNADLYDIKPKLKQKKLFNNDNLEPLKENNLFLCKKGIYKNDKELLYIILNCIFNSNNLFYIKKCQRNLCQKYYLTTVVNKEFCDRPRIVCEEQSTCCDAIKTLEKSKQYKRIGRLTDNFLSKYRKRNDEESIKFIGKFKEIVENEITSKCKQNLNITKNDIKKLEQLISDYKN